MLANMPRRGSQSINGVEAVNTPRQAFPTVPEQYPTFAQDPSPHLSIAQPASPYGSVSSAGGADGVVPGGVGAQQQAEKTENPVEVQNRLMREKLERARLQKQKEREQEQREEEERKERLRKKLEAMGLTDDLKAKATEREEQSPAPSANTVSMPAVFAPVVWVSAAPNVPAAPPSRPVAVSVTAATSLVTRPNGMSATTKTVFDVSAASSSR